MAAPGQRVNALGGARQSPLTSLGRSSLKPVPGLVETGAGEGNRTLVVSLEGFCSTIELHPQNQ